MFPTLAFIFDENFLVDQHNSVEKKVAVCLITYYTKFKLLLHYFLPNIDIFDLLE